MRIRICLTLTNSISIPINHQHTLSDIISNFLNTSESNYASLPHQHHNINHSSSPFQLFCFSTLRCRHRRVNGTSLQLGPGKLEWLVCSPVEKFLQDFTQKLAQQEYITLSGEKIFLRGIKSLPPPTLNSSAEFSCLTPVVCSHPNRHACYLTPSDEAFGETARRNLIHKFTELHGHAPKDENLQWQWDQDYLKRERGTKLIEYKSTFIKGAFAPFRVEGSSELIKLLYETGAGEKNASGFGMVEVQ